MPEKCIVKAIKLRIELELVLNSVSKVKSHSSENHKNKFYLAVFMATVTEVQSERISNLYGDAQIFKAILSQRSR